MREHICDKHSWRQTAKVLRIRIDGIDAYAFDDLEAHGFRFLVHFGVLNAVEKAQDEWFKRLEEKER